MSGKLSPGFTDTVGDAQSCFRLVLSAMAHPGRVHTVRPLSSPPPLCEAAAAVVLTLVDQEMPLWLDPDAAATRAWVAFHTGAPVVEEPTRAAFAVALSFPAASFPAVTAALRPPAMTTGAVSLTDTVPLTTGDIPFAARGTAPAEGGTVVATGGAASSDPVAPPRSPALPIGTDEAPETSATLILQIASLTTGRPYRLTGPGLREPTILTADGLPADFTAIWQRNHALFPRGIDLILCAGNQLAALPRSVSVQEA